MAKSKNKETAAISWHPDFRIQDTLPDVKVVRTDFIINFITITAAVLLAGFYGYRKLYSWDLGSRIADVEAQIEQATPENRRNLKNSGDFKKASTQIEDLVKFYSQSEPPLDFLVEISQTRPEYIALSSIEFTELERPVSKKKTVNYSRYRIVGVLQGSSAEALDALNKYREIVNGLDIFKDRIESIEVPPPRRNPGLDLFEFNIVVILKPTE